MTWQAWWDNVAMSGVVGGVVGGLIGGLATALAVWLTLRHERDRELERDLRADVIALREAAVTHVLLVNRLVAGSTSLVEYGEAHLLIWRLCNAIELGRHEHKELAADVACLAEQWLDAHDDETDLPIHAEASKVAISIATYMQQWLRDPAKYKTLPRIVRLSPEQHDLLTRLDAILNSDEAVTEPPPGDSADPEPPRL